MENKQSITGKIGRGLVIAGLLTMPLSSGCARFKEEMRILGNGVGYAITAPCQAELPEECKQNYQESAQEEYETNTQNKEGESENYQTD